MVLSYDVGCSSKVLLMKLMEVGVLIRKDVEGALPRLYTSDDSEL
jgi:hypothetical protein